MTETHTTHHDGSPVDYGNLWKGASLVGVIATIVSIAHTFQDPKFGTGSYLFGLIFWGGLSIGMLALALLHHMVRGSWSVPILRLLEAGGGATALLLIGALFIPVIVGVFTGQSPYTWANLDAVKADPILLHKSKYLNPVFWTARLVIFFGVWAWVAAAFRKSTLKQDQTKNFRLEALRSTFGALAMPAYVLSVTFVMTDWVMSLDSHWYSTMFGPWTLVGAVLASLAFCVVLVTVNSEKAPYTAVISRNLTKDLGNMLFVFTMLWGYTSLSQFLIIWNGNLPETTNYFVHRSSGFGNPRLGMANWGALGMLTVIGQFFVPFFSLIAPRTKRFPINLRKIAGWIFVVHIFDVYLLVAPSIPDRGALGPITAQALWDLVAFVGIGGLWLANFSVQVKKAALLPEYDNRLQEALAHAH